MRYGMAVLAKHPHKQLHYTTPHQWQNISLSNPANSIASIPFPRHKVPGTIFWGPNACLAPNFGVCEPKNRVPGTLLGTFRAMLANVQH